ncbi:MAG: 5-(carboxyamino)imidazole ribonucleotide synthase [Chitinispirillales bacterium]|jgi:5-(carboxyamino)imidazole ribonucleotide synthase|nr:5-(carboxyamino)imidazole ribonucleotide synthase [Chitinispirillales bacterium]
MSASKKTAAADDPKDRFIKIGIIGGGQLARMLALSGHPLGINFVTLEPAADACAAAVAEHVIGDYDDRGKLEEFASKVDVVTYEFENVPAESVKYLSEKKLPVYPPPQALAVSRDRLKEKTLFRELGIPTPNFSAVGNIEDLKTAVETIGLPAVLKSRTLGYDGKGQAVIKSKNEIENAWERVGKVDCILEGFIAFTREISVIAVRSREGEIRYYPVSENTHKNGILHVAIHSPNDPLQSLAEDYGRRLLEHLDYVGVLALELFVVDGATLMANEIAPRVHNTGHWTIEGAATSQFENHIRAVAGLPLGGTTVPNSCAMVNFIGEIPPAASVLEIKGAHFHDYGKFAKSGRKLGHATICRNTRNDVIAGVDEILALSDIS